MKLKVQSNQILSLVSTFKLFHILKLVHQIVNKGHVTQKQLVY